VREPYVVIAVLSVSRDIPPPAINLTDVTVPVLEVYPFGFIALYGVKPNAVVISLLFNAAKTLLNFLR